MRNSIIVLIVGFVAVGTLSPIIFAQTASQGFTWPTCPRCTTDVAALEARKKVAGRSFSPRDLSGVWGNNGVALDFKTLPPLTPKGQEMYKATQAEQPPGAPPVIGQTKDPMMICEPLGYPRLFTYNYGFEFAHLSNRVVQFFEWGHTWRDIWTDGRSLPAVDDLPHLRFNGYSVGRWEGDTFVIESIGYDERTWLTEDRRDRRWGLPHSDQMRIVERYRRTAFDTLEVSLTITDPVVFTAPWSTNGTIRMFPERELWEYYCVTSDSEEYNKRIHEPAIRGGAQR